MSERAKASRHKDLVLDWHRGATSMRLEGFQTWVLLALRPQIRFDMAIWGLGIKFNGAVSVHSAHLYGTQTRAVRDKDSLQRFDELTREALTRPGRAISLSSQDPKWSSPRMSAWREYATRYGLGSLLCVALSDGDPRTVQLIVLGRGEAANGFTLSEAHEFESLAPHMMLAYATRRELALGAHQQRNGRSTAWVTAIIDRAGHVHNRDADFDSMLRREWNDFDGTRLPDGLREQASDGTGTSWRHLGAHVVIEFSPVHDVYLVSARLRAADDTLSERERRIAQQYASGSSYKEIASALQLSPATVRAHVRNVFIKLGVNKKAQLARLMP
jgi:DNA-binding CsgD family transcriptional regulator